MNTQTQLELPLQNTDMARAAIAARAELYRIQADNLRKEAEKLHTRIAHLDAMVAYFSHAQ